MTVMTAHLDHLEIAGLILQTQSWPEREYRFRHSLVQDATYGSLLLEERRRIHLAAAKALERIYPDRLEELSPILGRHFSEAGKHERAYDCFIQAANQAAAVHAHQEADNFYKEAIELANGLERPRMRS